MKRDPEPLLVQIPWEPCGETGHTGPRSTLFWTMLPTVAWGDRGRPCQGCAKYDPASPGLAFMSTP